MKKIVICMFIDAMGWEIIKDRPFLKGILPHRYRVQMQFGYSSTAIPTILSGEKPTVHKHLSFYYYAPEKSPFKLMKYLRLDFLPFSLGDRWRVRHLLSKFVAKAYGFTGYFELYSMPYARLPYFDYIEKTDLFVPGGMSPVGNLADLLEETRVPYHISNWRLSESQNVDRLIQELHKGDIRFAFLYTAAMDGLLHKVTKEGKEISIKLDWYEEQVKRILETAEKQYDDIYFAVFSDHGMTTLSGVVDVKKQIESLGLEFGKDYVAAYDSTMARFWFLNENSRRILNEKLHSVPNSHVLDQSELNKYYIDFPDHMYGESILLMNPGVQIEPCDMGVKALPGMHGFAPEHDDSYAALLSSEPVKIELHDVSDYFLLMKERISFLDS